MSRSRVRRFAAAGASLFVSAAVAGSGPQAPEFAKFAEAVQTSPIDLFSGDFRYSVPVFEVPGPRGGFPLVLSYQGGVSPDAEASWAGLGWTLNPGSINRQLRGLPDDFRGDIACTSLSSGDCVATTEDIEPNWTFGLGLDGNLELIGADTGLGLGISAGLKGYYNSYRGLGYSRTIGLSGQTSAGGISAAVGLNLSNDSQQGFRASPSLSLADMLSVNANYDAVTGLSAVNVTTKYRDTLLLEGDVLNFAGYARPASLPGPGRDMDGWNIAVSVKGGGEVQGVYLNLQASGFYNIEKVKDPNERFNRALGYLHLDRAFTATEEVRDSLVLDFNRENDGPIYDDTPNLAVPVITNDIYTLAGPGIAGAFRAYRNDVPWLYDTRHTTELLGGAVGFDIGGGLIAKFGGSFSVNGTKGVSGGWDGGADGALVDALAAAAPATPPVDFERAFFKLIGENTPRAPGALLPGEDAPVAVPLKPEAFDITDLPPGYFSAEAQLTSNGTNRLPISIDGASRAPRGTVIESFTNAELDANPAAFPEFAAARTQLYAGRRAGHIGAFRVTGGDGNRYIYAIPVYNIVHEEHQFSVKRADFLAGAQCEIVTPPTASGAYDYKQNHTEQFRHVKKLSPYAITYLLTGVLGPDYVDADSIPGPSAGDYGYWVRLDYTKQPGNFGWRRPFRGAQFVRGPDNGPYVVGEQRRTDKAFFTYGEREEWYLGSIETRTHVARFRLAARQDGFAAASRLQGATTASGRAPQRLERIELYARDLLRPENEWPVLQTMHFNFDYSLQRGAPGTAANSGRLTLKKVWTTFEDNARGAGSGYGFDYEAGDAANNPAYSANSADRWGTYQPLARTLTPGECAAAGGASDPTLPVTRSYTDQGRAASARNREAAAWSLRRIVEPAGRQIDVSYEADDYALVQDQPAAVMTRIVAVGAPNSATPERIDKRSHDEPAPRDALRVYFAAPAGLDAQRVKAQLAGAGGRVAYRVRVALKDGIGDPANGVWETVSGYANVVDGGTTTAADGSQLAWLELERVQGFHPFSVAAWQHLRLVQPELMTESIVNGDPNADPFSEALGFLTLADFVEDFVAMIRGIYPTWFDRNWGQVVDLESSFLRLRVPAGVKYGGGTRVASVTYRDRWSAATGSVEPDLVTGYAYEYRLPDGRSSGVASYEPASGAEENGVRDAQPFTQKVLLSSSYNLFAETPLAESYFPAPSVGYSRVTVRTIASEQARSRARAGQVPTRTSTVGPAVHEFYTAADFPVRTAQTTISKMRNPQPWMVPIPFLGQITLNSLAASQGYTVMLNDMHGKPRRISRYEYGRGWDAARQDFQLRGLPDQSTEYVYRATGGAGGTPFTLESRLPVFTAEATRASADPVFGREAEMFIDTRRNRTESFDAGLNVNVDLTYALFPIPLIVPMPSLAYSLSEAKSAVAMKVVHQSGVLDHVIEQKGPARTRRQMYTFDSLTGEPRLTSDGNDFDDPVYTYTIPARWKYPRMGAAYPSVGLRLPLAGAQLSGTDTLTVASPAIAACEDAAARTGPCLPLGSRFAAGQGANAVGLLLESATASSLTLRTSKALSAVPAGDALLVASGDGNLLDAMTGTIVALSDPTLGRTPAECRWTTNDVCGVCYVKQRHREPSCHARAWIAWLGNHEDAVNACPETAKVIGRRNGRFIGGNARARVVNQPARTCRIVLVDDRGNEIDETAIDTTSQPQADEAPPVPQVANLPYAGVSFDALVNGRQLRVFVYSDCDGWIDETSTQKPLFDYCDTEHRQTRQRVKDVLSASTTLYSETWPSVAEEVRFAGSAQAVDAANQAFAGRSAFAQGTRGIWRNSLEYLYVENRRQSADVNLRRDGAFDLTMFDWNDPDNPVCAPQWRRQTQITRYAPSGGETEEVSPIGVYSASLYGHTHRVPLAVANNARHGEIASEGFEAFAPAERLQRVQTGEGNFRFYTFVERGTETRRICPADLIVRGRFDGLVLRLADTETAVSNPAASAMARIDHPNMRFEGLQVDIPGIRCPLPVTGGTRGADGRYVLAVDASAAGCEVPERSNVPPELRLYEPLDDLRIILPCDGRTIVPVRAIQVSNLKAHTGTKSLAVNTYVDFPQPDLAPIGGRRYVVSAWVSRDNTDVATYASVAELGVQVKLWSGGQELEPARPALMQPDGPIIDGWQRIQGTFEFSAGAAGVSIALQNGTGSQRAFFDDIRVLPEDGMLEAFVYDPATLRVVARLDAENYAKVYGYHDDGTLAQTQQETEAGKLTVIESRMHAAERP